MKKIAVFVSGSGSNLQALIDSFESGYIAGAKITAVFSNKADAYGLKRAEKHGILSYYIDPKAFPTREAYDLELAGKLNAMQCELLCLAGYMRILTKEFIDTFKGRIMNIHPALLPGHGGEGMYGIHVHEDVLKAGDKESGCSVHFVDYGTDTGPVILQKKVPVMPDDTPQSLQKRVLEQEHKAYPEAVKMWVEGKI